MNKQNLAALAVLTALACPMVAHASESELLKKIESLETRIKDLETNQSNPAPVQPKTNLGLSAFNPYVSVVLNGAYRYWKHKPSDVLGFQVGEEGETPHRGFSLGESEINMGANVDDKFLANLTAAIVNEDGEDKIELEEAYVQSIGLPLGLTATLGRMKPVFGYLNEKHTHTDEFSDRPLPYRIFLNNAYKDDGVQVGMVLPTDFYAEIGGGLYRGGFFPADPGDSSFGAANAYIRFGGDITDNQSWLAGLSYLYTKSREDGRESEDLVFRGKDNLYGASLKYTWAPTGNNKDSELTLQGEYLFRDEKGNYQVEDEDPVRFNSKTSGWYVQSTYKFEQNWKIGYRYARMQADSAPNGLKDTVLDAKNHHPETHSLMAEWNNSEFSRIRLQYNYDRSSKRDNHGIVLEYTMSFGAHTAHTY